MRHFQHFQLRIVAALMIAAALYGCGTTISSEDAARIQTIGLISSSGSTFSMVSFAPLRGSDKAVPDWELDETILDALKQALTPRFTVKGVSYDPAALRPPKRRLGELTLAGPSDFDIAGAVRQHVRPTEGDVDAYVIVWPVETPESFDPTFKVNHLGGLGIYHETGALGETAVFTNCMLTVVDARTFRTIAEGRLHAGSGPYQGSIFTPVGDTFDLGDPDRLTAQQRDRIKQVVAQSISATARTMNLRQ